MATAAIVRSLLHQQLFIAILVSIVIISFTGADEIQSLYAPGDHILELDISNFNDKVYNQPRAFFVEFYSSWCGGCIAYAPVFKKFAKLLKTWSPIVQVTVINCADDKNSPICREHAIDQFPTLKYFKYMSKNKNDGVKFLGDKHQLKTLPLDVAELVYNDWKLQMPREWPSLAAIDSTVTEDEIFKTDADYLAIIAENHPARASWAMKLHYVSERRIRIVNVHDDHPLIVTKYPDRPHFLIVDKNHQNSPIFSTKKQMVWTDMVDKVGEHVKLVDNYAVEMSKSEERDAALRSVANVDQFKVQMLDLSSALAYMITQEVPRKPVLYGDELTALKQFMHLLAQYGPGTLPIRRLCYRLSEWLNGITVSITSDEWLQKYAQLQDDLGNPLPTNSTWVACIGSKSYLRGYTCGLWTLFHSITVQAYVQDGKNADFKSLDILSPIHKFIVHYLSCGECARNFDELTKHNRIEDATKPADTVLWLWRAHNDVNRRLSGAASEDPAFPKIQFPSARLCPDCRRSENTNNAIVKDEDWDEEMVLRYLIPYYTDIRSDAPKQAQPYQVTSFERSGGGRKHVESKRLNPKFAPIAHKIDQLEETETRLRREKIDLNPQRRWQALDESDQHVDGSSSNGGGWSSTESTLFLLMWLIAAGLVLFFLYCKYRRNKSKFWKTFYYYSDYKL